MCERRKLKLNDAKSKAKRCSTDGTAGWMNEWNNSLGTYREDVFKGHVRSSR